MDKIQNVLLFILILVLGVIIGVFVIPKIVRHKSYLMIQASHPASVYADDKYVGKAPLTIQPKSVEVALRLVADDPALGTFDQTIQTVDNTTSRILVTFASDQTSSASVVVYYEKIGLGEVETSIVSLPNLARLKIDDQVRGFTPVKLTPTLGRHNMEVSFDGYISQKFEIETKEGFRVVAIVKLAKDLAYVPVQAIDQEPVEPVVADVQFQVKISSTPTGFLRVRKEPNSSAAEIGQVKPEETYELLDQDSNPDWYKIQFTESESGWISNQYAEVVEN